MKPGIFTTLLFLKYLRYTRSVQLPTFPRVWLRVLFLDPCMKYCETFLKEWHTLPVSLLRSNPSEVTWIILTPYPNRIITQPLLPFMRALQSTLSQRSREVGKVLVLPLFILYASLKLCNPVITHFKALLYEYWCVCICMFVKGITPCIRFCLWGFRPRVKGLMPPLMEYVKCCHLDSFFKHVLKNQHDIFSTLLLKTC